MRTLRLALLAGCLAAVTGVNPPPAADPVLFEVEPADSGRASVDPIAFIHGSALTQVPIGEADDSTASAFRRDTYDPRRRYRLLSGGAAIGDVAAIGQAPIGCAGLEGYGRLLTRAPVDTPYALLATGDARIARDPAVRHALTPGERNALFVVAVRILVDSGVPPDLRAHAAKITGAHIDLPQGRALLVGSVEADSDEDGADRVVSLLIGLERVGTAYKPTLFSFANGLDAMGRAERFVDAFTLPGDTMPLVVSATRYYESRDYTVYRWSASGWERWYEGGGGGC